VAIIGLITAAVLISFSGNTRDTELDQEAERLEALLDYVREQAELQTRDYGVRLHDRGYEFVVFDVIADQWRLAEEDDALREREIPEGIEPLLVVEGRTVVLERAKQDNELEDFTPQIMIFSNGDLSSFEVALRREGADEGARLYTDEDSRIRLLLPGQAEQPGAPPRTVATR
jgi:general secretion pathway protein H